MAVSFGTRIDDDTNFITEVDTEKKIAKTRGAIDGTPFVSSGGYIEIVEDELSASYNDLVAMIENGVIPYILRNDHIWYLSMLEHEETCIAWFTSSAQTNTVGTTIFYNDDPDAHMLID